MSVQAHDGVAPQAAKMISQTSHRRSLRPGVRATPVFIGADRISASLDDGPHLVIDRRQLRRQGSRSHQRRRAGAPVNMSGGISGCSQGTLSTARRVGSFLRGRASGWLFFRASHQLRQPEITELLHQVASEFVQRLFMETLNRPPDEHELDACLSFFKERTEKERIEAARYVSDAASKPESPKPESPKSTSEPTLEPPASDPSERACQSLAHVLLNHSDFVSVR